MFKPTLLPSALRPLAAVATALWLMLAASAVTAQETIERLAPPFPMEQLTRPTIPEKSFNIRDYGAREMDGQDGPMITEPVRRAIQAAVEAGGGKVVIPAGNWLSGPIHLKSNINLHLERNAEVFFSTDRELYLPVVHQRHEGVEAYNYSPMIYAAHVENVAITGQGTLNGQGEPWWDWFEKHGAPPRVLASQFPLSQRIFGKGSGMEGMRPSFVVFWKSENILVEGVRLVDGPMWNLHLVYSENIIVRRTRIESMKAPNGDGIVVDSSRNVLIEHNDIQTDSDAIVLKSGLNEDGLNINIPTENVVIRHFSARNVRNTGVAFGSETSGGIRNVYVHNGLFDGIGRGIGFRTERGRGNVVENIWVRDITMRNLTYEGVSINTFFTGRSATGPAPLVRNIRLRSISIDRSPTAINLTGLPEKWLENITLENVKITNAEMAVQVTRVKNLVLKDVSVRSQSLAMQVMDTYELRLERVSLQDRVPGGPLRLEGRYTGAVFIDDSLEIDDIQFGRDVSREVVNPESTRQAW
ncbi:glycoside hydrolase family 28 protein [Marinimicrobium sp. ABcell2]|uniref:glycoside hydrolase family 28 protein n=1 Tax=Marinimicrobium sp. ABcell2 TaxID=3069751 RepID=UPI0027B2C0AB|nr:glycoside hydrolase family 28 protein [Marinimicrobium sp. ABcell2]MDQ2075990.1 glycoside hydrolase family 28 protein [Marinimicrobium sp. ABcell2]